MYTLLQLGRQWFYFLSACVCNSFVDDNGYGNCEKEFRNQRGCYVENPSLCTDTKRFRGKLFSFSNACRKRIGRYSINQLAVEL